MTAAPNEQGESDGPLDAAPFAPLDGFGAVAWDGGPSGTRADPSRDAADDDAASLRAPSGLSGRTPAGAGEGADPGPFSMRSPQAPDETGDEDATFEDATFPDAARAPSDSGAASSAPAGAALPEDKQTPEALIDPTSDPPGMPPAPTDDELVALRGLLLSRELALLERLKHKLEDPVVRAREVSDVVAEAILIRTAKDEDKLTRSLDPVVENIVKSSLRRKPLDFANVIFPLMGPAIRKYIAETFHSMLESFHKSVEMAFSWKGLRWRLESLKTGKPFSEVVMLNTLVYRVEQIFLIHRQTGLVLNHLVGENVASQDADMVSAMLTAIQDFVRDCFTGDHKGDLDAMEMGDYTILVEQSPYAYLACVVRGTPPVDFRRRMRTSLELIQVEYLEQLVDFNGDVSEFVLASRHLEDCMITRMREEDKTLPLWVKLAPWALLLTLVCGTAYWRLLVDARETREALLIQEREHKRQDYIASMSGYVDRLRSEQGLVVVDVRQHPDAPWELICMKDELARNPYDIIREAGGRVENFVITIIPFISFERDLIVERLDLALRPPDTVSIDLSRSGKLRLSGTAPMPWILRARHVALSLPGVKDVDFSGLVDPRMEETQAMIREIESIAITFPLGKDTPVPEDAPKLRRVVDILARLDGLAREMGFDAQLAIYGHADTLGNDERNYAISQARARLLAAMLYAKGSRITVSLYGMGADRNAGPASSPSGRQASRRIDLKVRLTPVGPTGGEDGG
jgi:OOP family OmpA-OmpF porin